MSIKQQSSRLEYLEPVMHVSFFAERIMCASNTGTVDDYVEDDQTNYFG